MKSFAVAFNHSDETWLFRSKGHQYEIFDSVEAAYERMPMIENEIYKSLANLTGWRKYFYKPKMTPNEIILAHKMLATIHVIEVNVTTCAK